MTLRCVLCILVIYCLAVITSGKPSNQRMRRRAICGYKEPENQSGDLSGGGPWPSVVKYNITKYTKDLPEDKIRRILEESMKTWSAVLPIDFQYTTGKADLHIMFGRQSHGDAWPFDGPGGLLAHANPPKWGGFTHFDDDETFGEWSQDYMENGALPLAWDLRSVAIHELGHFLGLGHSANEKDIMYAAYADPEDNAVFRPAKPSPNDVYLAQRIHGARSLHGYQRSPSSESGEEKMSTDVPAPMPMVAPNRVVETRNRRQAGCVIDAITTAGNGATYIFKGSNVYKYERGQLVDGKPINQLFPGGPSKVTAVLSYYEQTALIEGRNVYLYNLNGGRFELEPGSPRQLPRIVSFVPKGAIYVPSLQYHMLIRGNLYCPGDVFTNRFERCGLLFKAVMYPQKEKDWKGMAVIDGQRYVFSATKFYFPSEAERTDGQGFQISDLISC